MKQSESLLRNFSSLRTVKDIACFLEVPLSEYVQVIESPKRYFHRNPLIPKKNGEFRETYRVDEPLKSIHQSIKEKVFWNLSYPPYLCGGIKDEVFPRNYIEDANLHRKAKTVAVIDLRKYFSTIRRKYVLEIFQNLLNFPEQAAVDLTNLSTLNGIVPQGAATSSYLSNLMLWDEEPSIVESFTEDGFVYSRYIDDITISHKYDIPQTVWKKRINRVVKMFFHHNLALHRGKVSIKSKGQSIRIHGLTIESGHPTIPKEYRNYLRGEIYRFKKFGYKYDEITQQHAFQVLRGKLQAVCILHPKQGEEMLADLVGKK